MNGQSEWFSMCHKTHINSAVITITAHQSM